MTLRVAVTGAGGYVGGSVVAALRRRGVEPVPILRRPLSWVPDGVCVDLESVPEDRLVAVLAGCDAVVHLAGANEAVAREQPDRALGATVVMARKVASAAAAVGVHRYVYVSTFHVYGADAGTDGDPIDEDHPARPSHPYGIARLAGELLGHAEVPEACVVLRLTNAVGPPVDARIERWTLVANELCRDAAAGRSLVLRSSGHQWRDFVDLRAAADAVVAAATGSVPPGTYNLGSGSSTRVIDLAGAVADAAERVLGRRPTVEAPGHVGAEPPPIRVDVTRLRSCIGPLSQDIDDALEATVALCARAAPPR